MDEESFLSEPSPTHTLFRVPSANHAVQGEQALMRAGIRCRLIPVPRRLSSQCGVCLRVGREDRHRAEEVLTAAGTVIEGMHDIGMTSAGVAGAAAHGDEGDMGTDRGGSDGPA